MKKTHELSSKIVIDREMTVSESPQSNLLGPPIVSLTGHLHFLEVNNPSF